ncbi:lactonase family protein [Terriglobus roseus]|nr:beta-propeller fold lactonase family protein [Terriglobus roseus]
MIDLGGNILRFYPAVFGLAVLSISGCRANPIRLRAAIPSLPAMTTACFPSTTPEFGYVLDGHNVSMFSVNSCTGLFTPTMPASISIGITDPETDSEIVATDPKGRFAYVANPAPDQESQSTISMYTISPTTGVLKPTSPASVPTGWYPQEMVIDPLGRFAYTANTRGRSISMFTIDQLTGVLTPTRPFSISTILPGQSASVVASLAIDPKGRFLYAPASVTTGAAVSMFTIDQSTGMLIPTSPASLPADGYLFDAKVTPDGRFLYVLNNESDGKSTRAAWEYSINSATGMLSPIVAPGVPLVVAGSGVTSVAIDPNSRFAYVVNRASNSVSMYSINHNTGALTLNRTQNAPDGSLSMAGAPVPFRITFDPAGKFVYVTNQNGAVAVYTVAPDGTLVNAGTTGPIRGALSVAIAPHQ